MVQIAAIDGSICRLARSPKPLRLHDPASMSQGKVERSTQQNKGFQSFLSLLRTVFLYQIFQSTEASCRTGYVHRDI